MAEQKYGSYRIETPIGSDSYGKLYKAHDDALDRTVALKVLSRSLTEEAEFIERCKKNMQALARLNHPRIPRICFFGEEGGEYFIAIEWCAGGSLSNQLRKNGRLSLSQGINIMLQCLEGLAAAWKLGIVHGNLKPNNILITDNWEIMVADFGLIPERPKDLSLQKFSGALDFMAPELGGHGAIDFRADIYSLGVIFHYVLLNSLPSRHAPESPESFLPVGAYQIIDRMTREDPLARYGSYEELLDDLDKLREHPFVETPFRLPKAVDPSTVADKFKSFFDLLVTLYSEGTSGILGIRWRTLEKKFLVRAREVIFFESNQANENYLDCLLEKGVIRAEELSKDKSPLESVLPSLISRGLLHIGDLQQTYEPMLRKALTEIFQWPSCECEFISARVENDPIASVRIGDLLLEACRSLIDYSEVRNQISPESLLNRTSLFEPLLSPLNLSPEESFIAYRFDTDDMPVKTLMVTTGIPEEKIFRFLYSLKSIGAIEFRSAGEQPAKDKIKKPAPRSLRPAPPTLANQETKQNVSSKEQVSPGPTFQAPKEGESKISEAVVRMDIQKSEKEIQIEKGSKIADRLYHLAESEYEKGNYWKATHHCKEAISHRQEAKYYHLLGASYSHHPRFQKDAEDAFHKAISLAPSDPDFHAILAVFYSQRELWLRARTHCRKALDLSAGHKMANKVYKLVLSRELGNGECWCIYLPGEMK